MLSWTLILFCIAESFCDTNEHIQNFLENKTFEDVVALREKYQRVMYLNKQKELQELSDSAQPSLVLAATAPSLDVLSCDANWHQYSPTGCCFRVSDAESDWYGGTAICNALRPDAQMASLHSQDESKFVANKYSSIHAWTGLSQTEIPNTWTYTDGTPDWHWFPALSSPPSDADSSCVEMMDGLLGLLFALSLQKGQTNPYSCSENIQILCKYCPSETTSTTTTTSAQTTTTTTPTTTTTTPTTSKTTTVTTTKPTTTTVTTPKPPVPTTMGSCPTSCPYPTVGFDGKCYKMCRGSVKFQDSCSWCNGTTVTVSSKQENDFISRVFGENDGSVSETWIGNSVTSGYLNWASGQPAAGIDGADYCISMDLAAGPTRGKHTYRPCESTVVSSICVQ